MGFAYLFKSRFFWLLLITGLASFGFYIVTNGMPLSFLFIGPAIYISATLKSLVGGALRFVPWTNHFVVLLPMTLLYFGVMGLHLARVKREQTGFMRIAMILVTLGFMGYVHYLSWTKLSLYYLPHVYNAI